jgi:WD40 repeat protein
VLYIIYAIVIIAMFLQIFLNEFSIHVFGKHSAQIKEVRWQPEQDYLLVQTMDDSFSIWDMTSGGLENCLYGKRGRDIFFAGKMLSREDIQFQMRSVSKQPFSRVTLHIPKGTAN